MRAEPVRAGELAPAFRLEDQNGDPAVLVDLVRTGPLVISFYQGLWCSHCELALEALAHIDGEIRGLGASQVAIGPPGNERPSLPIRVLADHGSRVARVYGLIADSPATYVVDRNGLIVLAANRNRLDPKDVLSALRCLATRPSAAPARRDGS